PHTPAVNTRVIVAESRRPAKAGTSTSDRERAPHPLVGAEFVTGAAQASQLPPPGVPEIAFAGRSNAGKSSAINALANRTRLAFASRTPGRTQQINLFALRGGALVADLPGYGYAAVAKSIKREWQDLLWQYVTTRSSLVALVLVVDGRHGFKGRDLPALWEAVALITTQIRAEFPMGAPQVTTQLFSAATRQGVPEAETTIAAWIPPLLAE